MKLEIGMRWVLGNIEYTLREIQRNMATLDRYIWKGDKCQHDVTVGYIKDNTISIGNEILKAN